MINTSKPNDMTVILSSAVLCGSCYGGMLTDLKKKPPKISMLALLL